MIRKACIHSVKYETGWVGCVVVAPPLGVVYSTRLYKREDRDGTSPVLRAVRVAKKWLAAHPEYEIAR